MKTFLCFFLHTRKILLSNLFLLLNYNSLELMGGIKQHLDSYFQRNQFAILFKNIKESNKTIGVASEKQLSLKNKIKNIENRMYSIKRNLDHQHQELNSLEQDLQFKILSKNNLALSQYRKKSFFECSAKPLSFSILGYSVSGYSCYQGKNKEIVYFSACVGSLTLLYMIFALWDEKNKERNNNEKNRVGEIELSKLDNEITSIYGKKLEISKKIEEFEKQKTLLDGQYTEENGLLEEQEKIIYEASNKISEYQQSINSQVEDPTEVIVNEKIMLYFESFPRARLMSILADTFFQDSKYKNPHVYRVLEKIFSNYDEWDCYKEDFKKHFNVRDRKTFSYKDEKWIKHATVDPLYGYQEIEEKIISAVKSNNKNNKNILLFGPPGNGKTALVETVIKKYLDQIEGEPHCLYFKLNPHYIHNKEALGDLEAQITLLDKNNPDKIFLFFDEFDGIISCGDDNSSMTASFKTFIDNMNKLNSVFIIGATNYLHLLEEGSIRNGRFNIHYEIGNPNYDIRKEIIEGFFKKKMNIEAVDSRLSCWINFLMCGHSCVNIKKFIERIPSESYTIDNYKNIFKQELLSKIYCQNTEEYDKKVTQIDEFTDRLDGMDEQEFIEQIKEYDFQLGLTEIRDNRIPILFDIPEISFYKDKNNDIMNNFSDMMQQQKQFLEVIEKQLTETGKSMQCKYDALSAKMDKKIDKMGYEAYNLAQNMMQTGELATQLKQIQNDVEVMKAAAKNN